MIGRGVVTVATMLAALSAGACSVAGREVSVVEATYGASCGAQPGNVTAAVAAACDGRSGCAYAVDVKQLGDPAVGCPKDFRVTWRCATDEAVRTGAIPGEAGLGSRFTLGCDGRAAGRIDVLTATTGGAPVAGLTAAVAERCAGRPSCAVGWPDLRLLQRLDPPPTSLHVYWRCEGELAMRESMAHPSEPARLACE